MRVSPERRLTKVINVGDIKIGWGNEIPVQSMITAETQNIPQATKQIIDIHQAGADIVRVTTPTLQDAQALKDIKALLRSSYQDVPLVADVHHQGTNIAVEASRYADKIRINPGLFVHHRKTGRSEDYSQNEINMQLNEIETALLPLIKSCKARDVPIRIGANHGSLAERLMVMYGDTPEGMVESVLEYIRIFEAHNFQDIIISLKASKVPTMIAVNKLMVKRMDEEAMSYPIHLGVTEAGKNQYGRIKSAIGIGALLAEGIGDTIRVSLTEDPKEEITACFDILQSLGLKKTKAEIISCPGCGRTKFDLPTITDLVTNATSHLKGLNIAVMGCIVNGPGEMADADYGFVGLGGGIIAIYRQKEVITTVSQEKGLNTLIEILKEDGKWINPPVTPPSNELKVLNKRISF